MFFSNLIFIERGDRNRGRMTHSTWPTFQSAWFSQHKLEHSPVTPKLCLQAEHCSH